MEKVVIISGTSHFGLAKRVADKLGKECVLPKIYRYGTGDFEVRIPVNVRRQTVFVIQTFLPYLEKVCYHFLETVFIVNAAYKASAQEVNLVVPHLGWDQSDKKWTGRMPIAGELIAAMFHYAGVRRYIGLHFHSPQFPGFFPLSCIVDHLVATPILIRAVEQNGWQENAVLVAGDLGFAKMGRKIADRLGLPLIKIDKERISGREIKIHEIYGKEEIPGKRVILWDDKIVRGSTMRGIIDALTKMGAEEFVIVATHGLFTEATIKNLNHPRVKHIIVTDSVPQSSEVRSSLPIEIVSIDELLAAAIREISIERGSVSKLFTDSMA